MNKKIIIALILIIIASVVTTFAIIIYNLKSVQNIGSANETIENFQTTSPYTTVPTSYDEVKLSPNAILTFLKHYDGCGHTIKEKENIDFTIVNGENSAEGMGITEKNFNDIISQGVDVVTMGNHTWGKKDIFKFIDNPKIIRPANYPEWVVGKGYNIYKCNRSCQNRQLRFFILPLCLRFCRSR